MKAIYPGTFDPVTYGHLDLIQRARKIFSKLIVAVAENRKKEPLFTIEERIELLKDSIPFSDEIDILSFNSLLVDFSIQKNAHIVIRGLRAVSDFEYEFQMALMNKKLEPEIETFFMMPDEKYTYLSSREIKEIVSLGGDVSKFVPEIVCDHLKNKMFTT